MRQPTKEEVAAGIEALIRRMLDVTLRLVRMENGQPRGIGSGFIYEHGDRHTLFSVLHCFQPNKADPDEICFDNWFIETDVVVNGQCVMVTLPPTQFVQQVTVNGSTVSAPRHVDFVWGDLDVAKLREKLKAEPLLRARPFTLPIYRGPIDRKPDAIHGYGFASFSSNVELVRTRGAQLLVRHPVHEVAMTFQGYDGDGLCRLKLEGKHKGHDVYRGSSGSPIADDERNIVALVHGGIAEENVILGVPIHRYASVINVDK